MVRPQQSQLKAARQYEQVHKTYSFKNFQIPIIFQLQMLVTVVMSVHYFL